MKETLKSAKEILAPITFNSTNFLKEIFTFINILFTGKGKGQIVKVYVKFINDVFGISLLEDDINALNFDELAKIYDEKFASAKKELFQINDLQIENFAINYLFMTALPISAQVKNFRRNIAKFLIEYKMAEFIFVCFFISMKDKWHELAIELVAADIADCLEHNFTVKFAIDDEFKDMESVIPMIPLMLDV